MNMLYKFSLHKVNFRKLIKEPNPYRLRVWLLVIIYRLYTFLCIIDLSMFLAFSEAWWLHKKVTFYTSPFFECMILDILVQKKTASGQLGVFLQNVSIKRKCNVSYALDI